MKKIYWPNKTIETDPFYVTKLDKCDLSIKICEKILEKKGHPNFINNWNNSTINAFYWNVFLFALNKFSGLSAIAVDGITQKSWADG